MAVPQTSRSVGEVGRVVTVSSANVDVDEEEHPHTRMPVAELLERTQERYDLYYLSPSAPVSVVVEAEILLSALSGALDTVIGAAAVDDSTEGAAIPATESAGQVWDAVNSAPLQPVFQEGDAYYGAQLLVDGVTVMGAP